ncbi:hypothetical protein C8J57DRAFT_1707920, partial [Mycena rebaudengoi]
MGDANRLTTCPHVDTVTQGSKAHYYQVALTVLLDYELEAHDGGEIHLKGDHSNVELIQVHRGLIRPFVEVVGVVIGRGIGANPYITIGGKVDTKRGFAIVTQIPQNPIPERGAHVWIMSHIIGRTIPIDGAPMLFVALAEDIILLPWLAHTPEMPEAAQSQPPMPEPTDAMWLERHVGTNLCACLVLSQHFPTSAPVNAQAVSEPNLSTSYPNSGAFFLGHVALLKCELIAYKRYQTTVKIHSLQNGPWKATISFHNTTVALAIGIIEICAATWRHDKSRHVQLNVEEPKRWAQLAHGDVRDTNFMATAPRLGPLAISAMGRVQAVDEKTFMVTGNFGALYGSFELHFTMSGPRWTNVPL